jgi:hypothetical protein
MLLTCEQLAAGLGASSVKDQEGAPLATVGNAHLGLWVGQKFLGQSRLAIVFQPCQMIDSAYAELYKRAGKEERVQKQIVANRRLEDAVRALAAHDAIGGKMTDEL